MQHDHDGSSNPVTPKRYDKFSLKKSLSPIDPEPKNSELTQNSYACPICGESMITLSQLNRHIDDSHGQDSEVFSVTSSSGSPRDFLQEKAPKTSRSTPQKRSLKLDLHENTSRFSLSENGDKDEIVDSKKLSRKHWKHLAQKSSQTCAMPKCKSVLNVKNGVVNCRKCGDLFCFQHTQFVARLRSGPRNSSQNSRLPVFDSVNGVLAKVCEKCYLAKPAIVLGTQANSVNLTDEFMARRRLTVDKKNLARSTIHARFLKLVELHSLSYLYHMQKGTSVLSFLGSFSKPVQYSKEQILMAESEIVGTENWQADEEASHCKLCFIKFGLLVRKHHCRLCGSVVNDGSFSSDDPVEFCSAQVPISLLLTKLSSLNYPPVVKTHWDTLIKAGTQTSLASSGFSVRVCKTCKNSLLHASPAKKLDNTRESADVLNAYDQILALKATITHTMGRYKALVDENKEAQNHQINRLRVRLRKAVKDLEIMVNVFMNRFFAIDPSSKKLAPIHSSRLVTNIYKASTAYLQESILELKRLNDSFQASENSKLAGQLTNVAIVDGTPQSSSSLSTTMSPTPNPRLTKKQIRELREQLMVTSEQKFIIESLMEDVKRKRKFDELVPLDENRKELSSKIAELTEELGEYSF